MVNYPAPGFCIRLEDLMCGWFSRLLTGDSGEVFIRPFRGVCTGFLKGFKLFFFLFSFLFLSFKSSQLMQNRTKKERKKEKLRRSWGKVLRFIHTALLSYVRLPWTQILVNTFYANLYYRTTLISWFQKNIKFVFSHPYTVVCSLPIIKEISTFRGSQFPSRAEVSQAFRRQIYLLQ